MSRILITSALLFALLAAPANAYELAEPAALPPVQTIAGEGVAYACNGEGWIDPWGNDCAYGIYMSADMDRVTYLHELGHHVDYLIPESDPFRYRFRELMKDPRPWRTSPNSPHEKFAEAYSFCARRDPAKVTLWWLRRSGYGYEYAPSPRVHRKVCRTIQNAMARYPNLFAQSPRGTSTTPSRSSKA